MNSGKTLREFIETWNGRFFDGQHHLFALQADLAESIGYITGLGMFVFNVDLEGGIGFSTKINGFCKTTITADNKQTCYKQNTLLATPGMIKLYDKIIFDPSEQKDTGNYNLWRGFKAEIPVQVNNEAIDRFKYIIKEIWASGNEDIYQYLIRWLATIIQTPWSKTGVGLFISGDQGSGKNTVTDFLTKFVFGKNNCVELCGLKAVTGRFNDHLQGKILGTVNELATVKDTYHSMFDALKSLITDDTIMIEPKGLKRYPVNNYLNLIMFSNNDWGLKIEGTDRRYLCLRTSNIKRGDNDFWDETHALLMNESAGNSVYGWLLQQERGRLKPVPMTEEKEELIALSKDNMMHFYDEIKSGEFIIPDGCKIRNETLIRKRTLFDLYCGWCSRSNEKAFSDKLFFSRMNKLMVGLNTTLDGTKVRCYILE